MDSLIIQQASPSPTGHLAPAENFWGHLELVELKYTKILPLHHCPLLALSRKAYLSKEFYFPAESLCKRGFSQ